MVYSGPFAWKAVFWAILNEFEFAVDCSLTNRLTGHPVIRQENGISNIINGIRKAKRRWAGHIARLSDNRWAIKATEWTPIEWTRKQGCLKNKMERQSQRRVWTCTVKISQALQTPVGSIQEGVPLSRVNTNQLMMTMNGSYETTSGDCPRWSVCTKGCSLLKHPFHGLALRRWGRFAQGTKREGKLMFSQAKKAGKYRSILIMKWIKMADRTLAVSCFRYKIPASKVLTSVESKISRFGFKDGKGHNWPCTIDYSSCTVAWTSWHAQPFQAHFKYHFTQWTSIPKNKIKELMHNFKYIVVLITESHWNPFELWNLESWASESGIQLKESGIPLTAVNFP